MKAQHVSYSNPGINKQLDTGITNCVVRTLEPVPQEHRPDIVDDKSHVMKHTVCESGVCLHCVSLGGLSSATGFLWERKHVVLQFPACSADTTVWCERACVLLMCCWHVSVRARRASLEPVLATHTCCWHWRRKRWSLLYGENSRN